MKHSHGRFLLLVLAGLLMASPLANAVPEAWALPKQTPEEVMLGQYLEQKLAAVEARTQSDLAEASRDWPTVQGQWRHELLDMLGLQPEPARSDLKATVTGVVEGDGFVVEKLHFQPMPQLYVTGNLYRPKEVAKPLPTILYLCGHSRVVQDGISLGNKTDYQRHGVWFAKHGYVCLVIDTIELGEFLGDHHGTYRLGRWWWPSRGYVPAGVEAWAGVRALDYLETRPEVDKHRFGVTGRSGGGGYSWWVAAIDGRVRAAVPTAGITTLRDHVQRGCVEGHCDCMFMHNTQRWDYHKVAALVAPRALCIANTDQDDIFPIGGVMNIYHGVRGLYAALGAEDKIGLQIAAGPHKDTQALNTGAFAWFERHLKGAELLATFDEAAKSALPREQLRVLQDLPKDERTTTIDQSFVPMAPPPSVPPDQAAWEVLREAWKQRLQRESFAAWPKAPAAAPVGTQTGTGLRLDISPEVGWKLPLQLQLSGGAGISLYLGREAAEPNGNVATFAPRGTHGITAEPRKWNQIRRRFLLLGETLEGQQAWDIACAIRALQEEPTTKHLPITIHASGDLAGSALYAAIFQPGVRALRLTDLPETHQAGPSMMNVLKILDLPQAVAMAAETMDVTLHGARPEAWDFATQTAARLGWKTKFTIAPGLTVQSVRKIWDGAPHNAFTSLVRYGEHWVCAFRESTSHVPGTDGSVRVLRSKDTEVWEAAAVVTEAGVDLRDAQLSITPDHRLMLLMGGSIYGGTNGDAKRQRTGGLGRVSFSTDGKVWSAPQTLPPEGQEHWLWKVTWHAGEAYGLSYPMVSAPHLNLWRSKDGTSWTQRAVNLPRGVVPTESCLRFRPDGTLLALVRDRDEPGKPPRHGLFGTLLPGGQEWQWSDLGAAAHGPEMLILPNGRIVYAGRDFQNKQPCTVVGFITDGRAVPVVTLPSGGDCSYPGMVLDEDGSLVMSYYSSHEGKASIYLARIKL